MDAQEETETVSAQAANGPGDPDQPPAATASVAQPTNMPEGVSRWSWGAFLLNGAWAIGNRTWLGVLALVPVLGLPFWLVLGFRGRAWAWRKGGWRSLEHFNKVQRRWTTWALVLYTVVGLAMVLPEAWP